MQGLLTEARRFASLTICLALPNELLEVASDELRAIVGDDSRLGFQVLLLGSLQDHFDIGFSHRLAQIPMHEETSLLQHPPNKMPPQDGYFFFWCEMLPFLPHTFAPLS